MTDTPPNKTITMIGAICGILAAIVAVVAAVVGAYLYIDGKYVHDTPIAVDEFWKRQESIANEFLEETKTEVSNEAASTINDIEMLLVSAESTSAEIRTAKLEIDALSNAAKNEVQRLRNEGMQIVKIASVSQNGPNEQEDNGLIPSRTLEFVKVEEGSDLRILYSDNLRVYDSDDGSAACRWTIRVNGQDCESGSLISDIYMNSAKSGNNHRHSSLHGICRGVPAGDVSLNVHVTSVPHDDDRYNGSDCYTGWNNSTWLMEAVELHIPE